jgi:hypothetical protein
MNLEDLHRIRLELNGVKITPAKMEEGNPCWEGYEQIGTKILDGREVPNCVPMKAKKIRTK